MIGLAFVDFDYPCFVAAFVGYYDAVAACCLPCFVDFDCPCFVVAFAALVHPDFVEVAFVGDYHVVVG